MIDVTEYKPIVHVVVILFVVCAGNCGATHLTVVVSALTAINMMHHFRRSLTKRAISAYI